MEIEVSEEAGKNIEKVANELGLNKKEIIARAVKLYADSLSDYVKLKKELYAWDKASDYDLAIWEKENI
mgnify:CR=1 FL=1